MKNGTENKLDKLIFELDVDEWHGYGTESVWVEPMSQNLYRLRNTPYFAKGVSLDDVVIGEERIDGGLYFVQSKEAAGHSTFRVLVLKNTTDNILDKYWAPLAALGCTFESTTLGLRLLAIDVPPETDVEEVYDLLVKGLHDQIWEVEESHVGHNLKDE